MELSITLRHLFRKVYRYNTGEETHHLFSTIYWHLNAPTDDLLGICYKSCPDRRRGTLNYIILTVWKLRLYIPFFPLMRPARVMEFGSVAEVDTVYGFTINQRHLKLNYGAVTWDSDTWQHKHLFWPWTTFYKTERYIVTNPPIEFTAVDYDDTVVTGTIVVTRLERRRGGGMDEFLLGRMVLAFNRLIFKPSTVFEVALNFDKEVGRGKQDWKGGIYGSYYFIPKYTDRLTLIHEVAKKYGLRT